MAAELTDDLAVDVLVVGSGLQAHYLAKQLVDRYSVCVLSDPAIREESLDTEGYLSAGYDGNDANRIQPARRAAGYWKLWAESNEVVHDLSETQYAVAPDAVSMRTRLWSDAALRATPSELPDVFADGTLAGYPTFSVPNDVVITPSAMLTQLRTGIEHCCLSGTVVKMVVANDKLIEAVDVEIDGRTVPIVPRFTVFAAGGNNATLLQKLAVRLRDVARRKERTELIKSSQAIRRRTVLCLRGPNLPLVSGVFGSFQVAAHRLGNDVVWLVNPPIDDSLTTLGPDDLRFDVQLDSKVVASVVRLLFGMSPELEHQAHNLRWGAYARRQTEHPMMATRNTAKVGQPSPAKIDSFGFDTFMALWPSHTSYAMIVGDVAAERIGEALGPRGDFGLAMSPAELAPVPEPFLARWERPGFAWSDWSTFVTDHGVG